MAFSFGSSTNKPTLNLGTNTNNTTGSSLFGNNTNTNTNTNAGSSLFGNLSSTNNTATTSPPATTSLFGAAPATQNQASTSLFGAAPATQAQPTTSLFGAAPATQNQSSASLFGSAPTTQNQPSTSLFGTTTNAQNQQAANSTSPSNPQIDIAHLRSTTKFDHLTPDLQQEISKLDTAILNQIRQSTEVSDLLPSVVAAGSQTAPAVEFVSGKLDELETGLENDAEAIVALRDGDLKKDEGEAKCVFRAVDRLKVPRQYQVAHTDNSGAAFGGVGNGLSGWWNQPSTLRGSSMRAAGGAGGASVQVVDEDTDDEGGPKNLVNLFEDRAREMGSISSRQRNLLHEIESFVDGLENKIATKERDVNERLEFGGGNALLEEREHQMQLLRFVFGEVQRGLYDVAEKVGSTRDGVVDLGLGR